jgi:hypothetical protein
MKIDEFASLVARRPKPLLLLDTCAVLDVVRWPFREELPEHLIDAALTLATAARGPVVDLFVARCNLIDNEFQKNVGRCREDLIRAITKTDTSLQRLVTAGQSLGLLGPAAPLAHLSLLPNALVAVAEQLLSVAITIEQDPDCMAAAFGRIVTNTAPSSKGQQVKDCYVIEHYLAISKALRSVGVSGPVVFVTSNVNDFGLRGKLIPPLDTDFSAVGMTYCAHLVWARNELGL